MIQVQYEPRIFSPCFKSVTTCCNRSALHLRLRQCQYKQVIFKSLTRVLPEIPAVPLQSFRKPIKLKSEILSSPGLKNPVNILYFILEIHPGFIGMAIFIFHIIHDFEYRLDNFMTCKPVFNVTL